MVSTILVVHTISNTDKLAKPVNPDFFDEKPSSLRLRKLMIAGSRLWWRYTIKIVNHPLQPFPDSQSIISTSIAYWQALLMHRLQNTISQTQYSYKKEGMRLILPHVGFKHGTFQLELDTSPKRHLIWFWWWATIGIFWFPFSLFSDLSHSNNPKVP